MNDDHRKFICHRDCNSPFHECLWNRGRSGAWVFRPTGLWTWRRPEEWHSWFVSRGASGFPCVWWWNRICFEFVGRWGRRRQSVERIRWAGGRIWCNCIFCRLIYIGGKGKGKREGVLSIKFPLVCPFWWAFPFTLLVGISCCLIPNREFVFHERQWTSAQRRGRDFALNLAHRELYVNPWLNDWTGRLTKILMCWIVCGTPSSSSSVPTTGSHPHNRGTLGRLFKGFEFPGSASRVYKCKIAHGLSDFIGYEYLNPWRISKSGLRRGTERDSTGIWLVNRTEFRGLMWEYRGGASVSESIGEDRTDWSSRLLSSTALYWGRIVSALAKLRTDARLNRRPRKDLLLVASVAGVWLDI